MISQVGCTYPVEIGTTSLRIYVVAVEVAQIKYLMIQVVQ